MTRYVTTAPSHYYPVGAPQTGGGGTAGLQDLTLFSAGGAAILAGFASLAYRRRLTRKRRAEADTRPAAPTHTPSPSRHRRQRRLLRRPSTLATDVPAPATGGGPPPVPASLRLRPTRVTDLASAPARPVHRALGTLSVTPDPAGSPACRCSSVTAMGVLHGDHRQRVPLGDRLDALTVIVCRRERTRLNDTR